MPLYNANDGTLIILGVKIYITKKYYYSPVEKLKCKKKNKTSKKTDVWNRISYLRLKSSESSDPEDLSGPGC